MIYGKYFSKFYENQTDKVRDKIDYVLDLVRFEERVPKKFLKHVEGGKGLYEVRVSTVNNNIRIFCFFDRGKLVILINSFEKKSQKTPKNQLILANKLMK